MDRLSDSFFSHFSKIAGALTPSTGLCLLVNQSTPTPGLSSRVVLQWMIGATLGAVQFVLTENVIYVLATNEKGIRNVLNFTDRVRNELGVSVHAFCVDPHPDPASRWSDLSTAKNTTATFATTPTNAANQLIMEVTATGVRTLFIPSGDLTAYEPNTVYAAASPAAAAVYAAANSRCAVAPADFLRELHLTNDLSASFFRELGDTYLAPMMKKTLRLVEEMRNSDLSSDKANQTVSQLALATVEHIYNDTKLPATNPKLPAVSCRDNREWTLDEQPLIVFQSSDHPHAPVTPWESTASTTLHAADVSSDSGVVVNAVLRPPTTRVTQTVVARSYLGRTSELVNSAYEAAYTTMKECTTLLATQGISLDKLHGAIVDRLRNHLRTALTARSVPETLHAAAFAAVDAAAADPVGWVLPRTLDRRALPIRANETYVLSGGDSLIIWLSLPVFGVLGTDEDSGANPGTANVLIGDTFFIDNDGRHATNTTSGIPSDPASAIAAGSSANRSQRADRRVRAALGSEASSRRIQEVVAQGVQRGRHVLRSRERQQRNDQLVAQAAAQRVKLLAEFDKDIVRQADSGDLAEKLTPKAADVECSLRSFDELSVLPERDVPRPHAFGGSEMLSTIFIPNGGPGHMPLHASFIKNVALQSNDASNVVIDFVALTKKGEAPKNAAPQFTAIGVDTVFLSSITVAFPTGDEAKRALDVTKTILKKWRDRVKQATVLGGRVVGHSLEMPSIILSPTPIVIGGGRAGTLVMKPGVSKGDSKGLLQIHQSGLRFVPSNETAVNIPFKNIGVVALFEATSANLTAVIHVHLDTPIPLSNQAVFDLQFSMDAGPTQVSLDATESRLSYDAEMRREKADQERIEKVNELFSTFLQKLQDAETGPSGDLIFGVDLVESDVVRLDSHFTLAEDRLAAEQQYFETRTLACEGNVNRSRQTIYFYPNALYAIRSDNSAAQWACVPIQDIQFIIAERLSSETEFDLVITKNDWTRVRFDSINSRVFQAVTVWAALTAQVPIFYCNLPIKEEVIRDFVLEIGLKHGSVHSELFPDPGQEATDSDYSEEAGSGSGSGSEAAGYSWENASEASEASESSFHASSVSSEAEYYDYDEEDAESWAEIEAKAENEDLMRDRREKEKDVRRR